MTKLDIIFPDMHNLYTLGVIDVSVYDAGFAINNPSIEITPPSFNKVVARISPRNLTIYNSNILGITCSDDGSLATLPDGIWSFKYAVTPITTFFVEKKFLKVDNLKAAFENMFLKMDMTCHISDKDFKRINQIEFLIQGAIAAANDCNEQLALKLYSLAQKMINNG